MGVYYGMNGLWVPVGGQGGTAPIDPNLLAENIKSGVTISGITGTFTNDGTAKASDIASGKTAYVNGEKVTGIISTYTSSGGNWAGNTFKNLVASWSGNWENQTDNIVTVVADANYNTLLRKDAGLHVNVPKSEFGDATAADVASGKTFTSSAGLKVTGTNPKIVAEGIRHQDGAYGTAIATLRKTSTNSWTYIDITVSNPVSKVISAGLYCSKNVNGHTSDVSVCYSWRPQYSGPDLISTSEVYGSGYLYDDNSYISGENEGITTYNNRITRGEDTIVSGNTITFCVANDYVLQEYYKANGSLNFPSDSYFSWNVSGSITYEMAT